MIDFSKLKLNSLYKLDSNGGSVSIRMYKANNLLFPVGDTQCYITGDSFILLEHYSFGSRRKSIKILYKNIIGWIMVYSDTDSIELLEEE